MTQNNSRRPKKTQKSKVLPTDRPTDLPTDGAGCRVACTRLKSYNLFECSLPRFWKAEVVMRPEVEEIKHILSQEKEEKAEL